MKYDRKRKCTFFLSLFFSCALIGNECEIDPFPVTFNYLFNTGYIITPSARMTECGEVGLGAFHMDPFTYVNGRAQPFSRIDFSINYRIDDTHNLKDNTDKDMNAKLAIFLPEDSAYMYPGLAVGVEDFIGNDRCTTCYAVATQNWINYGYGIETSVGWGAGRFRRGPTGGFFAGVAWFPFIYDPSTWTRGLSFAAEVDPTNCHFCEVDANSIFSCGVKYQLFDMIDLTASYVRGHDFAYGGSIRYNWGGCDGILPKFKDPPLYFAPQDHEPLGCVRTENIMITTLAHTLQDQGFRLNRAWIENQPCGQTLWVRILNQNYRHECDMRMRVQHILGALIPQNISCVVVIVESYGLPCQQYVYSQELLEQYVSQTIDPLEFDILTSRQEVSGPYLPASSLIYERHLDLWNGRLGPRYETFFGQGYKYDLGVKAMVDGFFPYDIFYELQVSYTLLSNTRDAIDCDPTNPSQLPVVLTDYVNYRRRRNFSTDKAYLQKNYNLGSGIFSKLAVGYFQVNYGGVAGELLWYPASSNFAIGLEGAALKKRRYTGLGFQDKLKRMDGTVCKYRPYTTLQQYFLDFYVDIPQWQVAGKLGVGQFLAYDKGVRLEAEKYFDSGVRVAGWITFTDAHDKINGQTHYNKGIIVEIPLDLFLSCSSKRVWNSGMAQWLRDAGATTTVGRPLFDIINRERRD